MLCPVCKTEYGLSDYCPICGFDEFKTEFLNKEEAKHWYDSVVMPYFEEYCLRFSCKTKGRKLFKYISNFDVVKLPSGIETIGRFAFPRNSEIKEIILPNTVKRISNHAFAGQKHLSRLIIPKSVEEIEEAAFSELSIPISPEYGSCYAGDGRYIIDKRNHKLLWIYPSYDIPNFETIKIIGRCALDNLMISQSGIIEIPEDVEEISGVIIGPFNKRNKVKEIKLPSTLRKLSNTALSCLNIDQVVLPENICHIGDYAFAGTQIKDIYIPKNVTYLGQNIVGNCKKLENITVSKENENYYSLDNCIIGKDDGTIVASCKTSVIPTSESVTEISNYAFCRFKGTQITIPKNIIKINEYAFDETGPFLLVSVDKDNENYFSDCNCIIEKVGSGKIVFGNDLSAIPRYVDSIGTGAFSNRDESIVIPKNIATVEPNIFSMGMMGQDCDDEDNIYRWGYVFCEAESKPESWSEDWLGESEAIVCWKNEWSYVNGRPQPI